jgi:hypothetical protein
MRFFAKIESIRPADLTHCVKDQNYCMKWGFVLKLPEEFEPEERKMTN